MKNLFILILLFLSINAFAQEIKSGDIIQKTPKNSITITALNDIKYPKLNNQIISNNLYKNSQIIINKNNTGSYIFHEDFSSNDWQNRALFFRSGSGNNLVIHQGGELGDGALVSDNAMFEDTIIYLIDTHFYPITNWSIEIESFETEDTEIFISEDFKTWDSLGLIKSPKHKETYEAKITGPFFIKLLNKESGKWICLKDLKITCDFKMNKEIFVYVDPINNPKWRDNFIEIKSDLDEIKYGGDDGLLNGDGNAQNQYVIAKINSPKAVEGNIIWTSLLSAIGVSVSCDNKNYVDIGNSEINDLNFNNLSLDKDILKKINQNYKDGYYIKLKKAGTNWFALYNFATIFQTEKTFDFTKIKNNIIFSSNTKEGKILFE